ncbi:MAG: FtsW/RodA/SpoVE family cell cycle protein [Planctomycetota bacterium]
MTDRAPETAGYWRDALLCAVLALCGLGLGMAISIEGHDPGRSLPDLLGIRLVALGLGFAAFLVARRVPLEALRPLILPVFALALAACMATHLFRDGNGAHRWIRLGGFSFQPVELLKPTVILATAEMVVRRKDHAGDLVRGLLPALAPALLAFAVLVTQPDIGHAFFVVCTCLAVVLHLGFRARQLLGFVGAGVVAMVAAFVAFPHFRDRVGSFLGNPSLQVERGLQALGEGGLMGLGPGEGVYQLGFLPEAHNDFVLAVLGNELGLAGSLLVLVLFGVLFMAATRIATSARSDWQGLVALGLGTMLALQACLNILGVLELFPEKGINLPFLSAGGSNLLFALVSIGILVNVADRAAGPSTEFVEGT